MLRIVAGRFRGRRLHTTRGRGLRPTADRMKESIYDVLQARVPGARVLDLYAGSGSLGLEALSRGASHVVLVECSRRALEIIRRNLELLGVQDEVDVVAADALRYLAASAMQAFDLILADPPYDAGVEDDLLAAVQRSVLRPGGCFVLQHVRRWRVTRPPEGFELFRSKRFGDTVVDFLVRGEETHVGRNTAGGALPGDV
ncbi:MAG: 16S rRNA (guanine(966)-N(2))-methyltransferase RsmD [Candidatus Krumholzibacteriia bacterium]